MNSYDSYSSKRCYRTVSFVNESLLDMVSPHKILSEYSISNYIDQLHFSCEKEEEAELSDMLQKPMVWIGIYIAVASFFCILAMAADLLHGFRHKKFWFPCNYFSLNAASMTVIAVAMKLPGDLTGRFSFADQESKLGSLAFLCTIMANLMPSLAAMDNKTLLSNVIGLCVLVITIVVDICIQMDPAFFINTPSYNFDGIIFDLFPFASIYTAMVLLLLIIMISSALTIPASKEILESKYHRATNNMPLTNQHIQVSLVEKLKKHVRRYWVIAETGSPQFVMASSPLSAASGVICVIAMLINSAMLLTIQNEFHELGVYGPGSPYKWSTTAIFITQSIGVLVGSIAPISRCFSVFSFKLATKLYKNHFMVFKVEKYWTQKLREWKQSPMPFLSSSRRSTRLVLHSKNTILSLCIGFQKVIVVSCKVIWLIATIIPIIIISCLSSLKARCFTPSVASTTDDIDGDLSNYVLQVNNEMELHEKILKRFANSINPFMLQAEKKQNNNLLKLLEKSTRFKGVETFDSDHVQSLLSVELVNNWSLPIITLTCIAVSLPNISKNTFESLVRSVSEGLSFTHLVEESLNCSSQYVNLRKASRVLWHEVEYKCKWLDNPLVKNDFKGKTTTQIVKWFSDKAKEMVIEIKETTDGDLVENPPYELIVANSMYRMTQTILLGYQTSTEPITKKQLFAHLNGMVADIFSACFTNIPRVIKMRCHESVIEKREASVKVAAELLGKTTKIIERLETVELPSMDEDKMAYIDEWRLYMKQSIP